MLCFYSGSRQCQSSYVTGLSVVLLSAPASSCLQLKTCSFHLCGCQRWAERCTSVLLAEGEREVLDLWFLLAPNFKGNGTVAFSVVELLRGCIRSQGIYRILLLCGSRRCLPAQPPFDAPVCCLKPLPAGAGWRGRHSGGSLPSTLLPAPRALLCLVERRTARPVELSLQPLWFSATAPAFLSLLCRREEKLRAESWQELWVIAGWGRSGVCPSLSQSGQGLRSWALELSLSGICHEHFLPPGRRQLGVQRGLEWSSFWELLVVSKDAAWTPYQRQGQRMTGSFRLRWNSAVWKLAEFHPSCAISCLSIASLDAITASKYFFSIERWKSLMVYSAITSSCLCPHHLTALFISLFSYVDG